LRYFDTKFVPLFKNLVAEFKARWGDKLTVDVDAQIEVYRKYAPRILSEFVIDSVDYLMTVRTSSI